MPAPNVRVTTAIAAMVALVGIGACSSSAPESVATHASATAERDRGVRLLRDVGTSLTPSHTPADLFAPRRVACRVGVSYQIGVQLAIPPTAAKIRALGGALTQRGFAVDYSLDDSRAPGLDAHDASLTIAATGNRSSQTVDVTASTACVVR